MIKQLFIRFLKENKIYYKYLYNKNTDNAKNWRREWDISNNFMLEYIKNNNNKDLIMHAFEWKITKEGHEFWKKKDIKWRQLSELIKN